MSLSARRSAVVRRRHCGGHTTGKGHSNERHASTTSHCFTVCGVRARSPDVRRTAYSSSHTTTMGREGFSKKRSKDESPTKAGGRVSRKRKPIDGNSSAQLSSKGMTSTLSSSALSIATAETFFAEYCELPFTLQTILVDESTFITRKGFDSMTSYDVIMSTHRPARSVHVLPARVTVFQVLQQYLKKRGGGKNNNSGSDSGIDKQKQRQVSKFCEGLKSLFDNALPVCLLYPEERPQYEALQRHADLKLKCPCEIYGNSFLLRLILRLPTLLRAEPPKEMEVMGPMISDLIVLLQKNRHACFKEAYREPGYYELLPWEKALVDDHTSAVTAKAGNAAEGDGDGDRSLMSES